MSYTSLANSFGKFLKCSRSGDVADAAVTRDVHNIGFDTSAPKPRFIDTVWRRLFGIILICYGIFNTYLYIKFTPVYVATECGQPTAVLQYLTVDKNVHVGLEITLLCKNPNNYNVVIEESSPGGVYFGQDRDVFIGNLSLEAGSMLPGRGEGDVVTTMHVKLAPATSQIVVSHLMQDPKVPLWVGLRFKVGVGLDFGLARFGTSANFEKECGMYMAGILIATGTDRLGPMLCKNSFDDFKEVNLPDIDDSLSGTMHFSAAQMDEARVRWGEETKDFCIISVGGFCYLFGFFLTCSSSSNSWTDVCCGMCRPEKNVPEELPQEDMEWTCRCWNGARNWRYSPVSHPLTKPVPDESGGK